MSLMKRLDDALTGETQPDAIELLKADHKDVADLLDRFEEEKADKPAIAAEICAALKVHAQIEEEIFYPAARDALEQDDEDLVDEADVEHATIKGLIGRIESVGSSDDHFDALVKVLGEYVKHHVKEEEHELFPKLRRSSMNLEAVGAALALRKRELESHPERQTEDAMS